MSHFVGLFLLCLAVTLAVLGNGHKPWILNASRTSERTATSAGSPGRSR